MGRITVQTALQLFHFFQLGAYRLVFLPGLIEELRMLVPNLQIVRI